MIPIIGRNIKIFFRDKANVFFSLLAVLIIIGLYVFFLGKNLTSALGDSVGAQYVMDSWIMSGVISVSGVTTTMGAFAVMIDDRANKILKDFTVSPIRSSRLAGAYILSSVVVGFIMSLVTFVLAEAYIFLNGGELLAPLAILKMLGLILLRLLKKSLRECKKHQQKSFHHFSLAIFPQKREPLGPFFLYFSDYFSHICDKYGRCTLYSHTK